MGTFERGVGSLAFSKAVSIPPLLRITSPRTEKDFRQTSSRVTLVLQDSGQHLSVIDDCNDHMLTVWNWQKKSKVAEIKVNTKRLSQYQSDVEGNVSPGSKCSLMF